MKLRYFIFIFVLTNDLKHYLNEDPLLEMINEAPKSKIIVTAKNNSNWLPRILLHLTANIIAFCE